MANEPDGPAQLYRSLNERLENSDKEGAIELYYELLSSGHSIGEILNGVGPVRDNSAQDKTVAAEQSLSGHDGAQNDITAEVAVGGVTQANTPSIRDMSAFREADGRRTGKAQSAPPNEAGSEEQKQLLSARSPGSEPRIVDPVGAYVAAARDATTGFGDQERFWSRKLPSVAASIAFWALYTGVVASASIAGFSLLRGGRDTEPLIAGVQSHASSETEAVAMPGAAGDRTSADRSAAVAEFVEPRAQIVDAAASLALQLSPQGEPDSAALGPLQPVAMGGREPVAVDRREAEAAPQSNTGRPDAIGQLIMQLTDPAEAPHDSAPAPAPATSVGPSPSLTPTGPAETASLSGTGRQDTGDKPQAASTDEAKATATVPTREGSAALPSATHAAKSRRAHAPRRDAGLRHSIGRRTSARRPPPDYAGGRRPSNPGQGVGAYDIDLARGYGQGAYGPAPYSDTGN